MSHSLRKKICWLFIGILLSSPGFVSAQSYSARIGCGVGIINSPDFRSRIFLGRGMVVYPSPHDFTHLTNGGIFKPRVTAQPAGGTFQNAQSVGLTTDEQATIYFTTDNSLPTVNKQKYDTLINIASTTTLKFFAVDSYGNQSDIQTETYTIQSVAMTAGNIHVVQGEMRQAAVTLTSLGGFNESMNVSYAFPGNVPAGATVNIEPAAIAPTASGATAVLSFTTAAASPVGSYPLRLTATGGGHTVTKDIQITIAAPLTIVTDSSFSGVKEQTLSPITTSGGIGTPVFTYTGTLPPGLVFNPDGTFGGKPTTRGTYTFTVQVADNDGHSTSRIYSVRIYDQDFRKIIIEGPWIAKQGVFSGYMTLKVLDDYDQPKNVATDTDILISSSSLTGIFAIPGSVSPDNSTLLTIIRDTPSRQFRYKDTTIGTPTITAVYDSPNWQSFTHAFTVTDLPVAAISGTPASPTNATSAILTIGGTDVVAYKYKLDDPTGSFPTTEYPVGTPIHLTSLPDGSHTVLVIGKDAAGYWQNAGAATAATWIVDTSKPSGTISINGGALGTNSTSVTLNFSASDAGSGGIQVAFSNDGDDYTPWEAYNPSATIKSWTIPDGVGTRTVYVKFKDATGNESDPTSYTLTLETTPPVPVITFPSDGTAVISVLQIRGTVSDPAPSSELATVEIALSQITQEGTFYLQPNKTDWNKTPPVYHLASLSGGDWNFSVGNVWESQQLYTVTARATDNAGNQSSTTSAFTYIVQTSAYTTLTMDLSSQTILNGKPLVVTGKLSRLPEVNMDLRNLRISLDITTPSGGNISNQVSSVLTGVDGSYTFSFSDNNTIFTEKGSYALQAKFDKMGSLAASSSDTKAVLVGASAGYAILVQGKLPGPAPEGLASHNKTTNRIYKTLTARGFDDANILYFNYTKPQAGVVVDEIPSKEGVQSAIEGWASGKMNAVPAPLYVIMVDHGVPNAFHIGDKTISPAELSSWLDALEGSLDQEARQEKIITIIGACYSGSFIPAVSKPNTNRIIITSAAANEESYKGPREGDDAIRSGEYFIDALFVQLGRGYSLKNSFEEATRATEEYTRKGGSSTNSPNPYFDTAMQHPLIDDNRDTRGSNVLGQGQGDGQETKDVYLGTGMTYNTNAGKVEIIGVTETKYLTNNVSDLTALLTLKVNNPTNVSSAWAIIRPPDLDLSQNQTTSSYQRDIALTPQRMPWKEGTGQYELQYDSFTESGMYEIFYYIIETGTPAVVSSLKRSVVYKDKAGNAAPSAPTLVKPAADEVTGTTLIFQWNASIDTDPVTYNLVIATDSGFANVVYRKDGMKSTFASVDASAGLKDLASFYWRVEAVDGYTVTRSEGRIFKTNNTNGLPGILAGIVFSDRDYSLIVAATIQVKVNNILIPVEKSADGSFVLSSLSGTATLEISAPGYQPLTVSDVAVVAGDTTPVNIMMDPDAGQKGDLNGDEYVTVADAILALQITSGRPPAVIPHLGNKISGDGKIGMADAIYIMQKVAGMR